MCARRVSPSQHSYLWTDVGSNITAKASFFLETPAEPILAALSQGFILTAIVFNFNKISGGHANPSVTLGWLVTGRLRWGVCVIYWIAQVSGALGAAALLMISYPTSRTQRNATLLLCE